MPVVVIQQDEAVRRLDPWQADPQTPDQEAEERMAWDDACERLVQTALQEEKDEDREDNEKTTWSVFLLFDPEEFPARRNGAQLSGLIRRARNRTWGSRLLLVLNNAPPIKDIDVHAKADMTKWMKRALAGRVTDLIEIRESPDWDDRDVLSDELRDRAGEIDLRQKILQAGLGHRRRWRGALPANWKPLADFLGGDLTTTQPDGDPDVDLLIVLEYASSPKDQEAEIERHRSKVSDSKQRLCQIVTYKHGPSADLQRYCDAHQLGTPITVDGDFELWYLLLRLNAEPEAKEVDHLHSIQPVQRQSNQIHSRLADPSPVVLLTSVFGKDEGAQWLQAATDVGSLLHRSPLGMEYHVALGIDRDRLKKVLDGNRGVNIWIHMGHGQGNDGLWVAHGYEKPGKWIRCFHDRELLMALFLTCNSHVIARDFAAHGTGVAIGIEGIVESNRARELAIGIMNAVMAGGMKAGSIAAGFRAGRARIESVQLLGARARAYYPRTV